MKRIQPYAVYTDQSGNMFEDTKLYACGRNGNAYEPLYLDEMIELPEGSEFFTLPGRKPIGYDKNGNQTTSEKGAATAAFLSPAYTQLHFSAYESTPDAPTLPLYAYSVLAWYKNKFYTSAVRIDSDERQDFENFDQIKIEKNAKLLKEKFKNNRLVGHILNNCALTYYCPAARNFAMGRWEAPIPTSMSCNANCIGCISKQSSDSPISCTQPRLVLKPTVQEIAEYTVPHLKNAERPVVSFGQGCEGEPLLQWELIRDAIKEIRKHTDRGIINLNSNSSMPNAVEELCKAGLNSIRVSCNSLRKSWYEAYYRPSNYQFEDIVESIRIARKYNIWISLNYFVMPGFTDHPEEVEALRNIINTHQINMIQWRNFNIDPDWLFERIGLKTNEKGIGVLNHMLALKRDFPKLAFGYFNPPLEVMNIYKSIES